MNNAGIILVGPLESQSLASYRQAMDVNFFGALHTTLAVLPQMLARGEGAIVNIASIGGKVAFPYLLPYVASKFAMTGWSQGLRAELAGKGIRVTTVSPGIMRTGSHIQARFSGTGSIRVSLVRRRRQPSWNIGECSQRCTQGGQCHGKRNSGDFHWFAGHRRAARLFNLAHELTAGTLSFANRFLPDSPSTGDPQFWAEDRSIAGKAYRGSLPKIVERLGNKPIEQYNEHPISPAPNQLAKT